MQMIKEYNFDSRHRPALGFSQPPQRVTGVKWPEHEAENLLLSGAKARLYRLYNHFPISLYIIMLK